jgi:hypothetical protein
MTDVDTFTIAEFLLARIAEDEARVEALTGEWPDEIAIVPNSDAAIGCVAISTPSGPKAYVRVWSPLSSRDFGWHYHESGVVVWSDEIAARVLAECEAKRKIVELHRRYGHQPTQCITCGFDEGWEVREYGPTYPCDTLKTLAEPYADHPDYRDDWDEEPLD